VKNVHVVFGQRGRTTIPHVLRKKLGWQPGDLLTFSLEGENVTIRREKASPKSVEEHPTELTRMAQTLVQMWFALLGGARDG
jgi:AbrB family looped-hinge helix DNA binding protein